MTGVSHPADKADLSSASVGDVAAAPTVAPYRVGPVTMLVAWIDRSGPVGWLACLAAGVAMIVLAHLILWATGRLPIGTIDASGAPLPIYAPYAVVVITIGRRIAARSLVAFWPATGFPPEDRASWAYRFDWAPARVEWTALVVGGVAGLAALVQAPATTAGPEAGRLAAGLALAPMFLLGYSLSAAFVVVAVRWLTLVDRIHREGHAIDPFDRAPIYAFSRLTVFIGLAIVLEMYVSFTVNAGTATGNVSVVFAIVAMAVAVLAFVAPLWGIHDRLVEEKARMTLDVERRISRASIDLYARVDAGSFDEAKVVTDSIAGLNAVRDRIARTPTWPWPPQVLRGFVTALLLPIAIYLATRLISTSFSL